MSGLNVSKSAFQLGAILLISFWYQVAEHFKWKFPRKTVESPTKKELFRVKLEIRQTSAQDQFAKWAKLRRRYDKLLNQYQQENKDLFARRAVVDFYTSWCLYLTTWILIGYMLVFWSFDALFYLPGDWFGPIHDWLLFPFAPSGSVGAFYWFSCCRSCIYRLYKCFY